MKSLTRSILSLLLLLVACGTGNTLPEAALAPSVPSSPTIPVATALPSPRPTRLPASTPTTTPSVTATPSATTTSSPQPTATPAMTATPTPDPLAVYAADMRPDFVGDIAAHADLPRYALKMQLDSDTGLVTGRVRITFTNTTGAPLSDVALRLYPNFAQDLFGKGGNTWMNITDTSVDGQPVTATYLAQDTAIMLPLVIPLAPGQTTHLNIGFRAAAVPWADGTWPLPSYYPMLAVRDGETWRLDVTSFPDRVFSQSAFYTAEITVPAGLMVITSGQITDVQAVNPGYTTYHASTGPVRQFALTVGNFSVAEAAAGDVLVRVYQAQGNGYDAQAIAQVAADALTIFEQRFGPYPYRELDLQLLPYTFDGGDEYPGMIFVYTDGIDAGTRYVTAHEVAHQWWFGLVGNDIYREPWLDEAFAQYSGIMYAEDGGGSAVAAADWEREVMQRYRGALSDGDLPIGWAISDYADFNVYYRTVYGKGAVFLRTLRTAIGDEAFFAALQSYYQEQRYGVATTQDVQRAFESASGQELESLFREWVRGDGRDPTMLSH